jgi:penicillin-binding protein 1A
VQGGSTITQQLSKNVFLSPDKTMRRKMQEMLMAIWLERSFTKEEILELYLSKVYFGTGAWGLEAASQRYFDKPAAEMNLSETALLAGLLKAPSAFNPVNHPERAAGRTAVVLRVLKAQDLVDDDMYQLALNYPIRIHRPQSDNSAQYFIDWIWPDIEKALGDAPTQDILVQTTLDLEAQILAHNAVIQNLDLERQASQAALVTLNSKGEVIAMIGGASYSDSQFNRATQAQRQPGSAFKPFVYLTALEKGITPWNKREDSPITLTDRQDSWTPQNFNKQFLGEMSVENAFAKSINTVAVKLGEELGRDAVIETAERFGFKGLSPIRSLALGSYVTTPLQLTQAYLPFAAQGQKVEPYGILSISTSNGTPLYDRQDTERTLLIDTKTLAEMNRMMTRTVEIGTGRKARIQGRDIGGKTGTTNDFRDAWFVGYSSDIVTGIWVGNDDNKSMNGVTGGTLPAQIFQNYMGPYFETLPTSNLIIAAEPSWVKQQRKLDNLLNSIEDALP